MSEREIRYARSGEEDMIMRFLQEHWASDFSVARSRELFDFLYAGKDGPNFVLALDGNRLVGTLGLIFYDDERSDVFLTLWRSIDTRATTGIEILKFVLDCKFDSLSSVGTREEVLIFYKLLKFNTGSMEQWVRVNPASGDFKILKPSSKYPNLNCAPETLGKVQEVSAFDSSFSYFLNPKGTDPFKSHGYLTKRYLQHPIYRYRVFEYSLGNEVRNYFVTRTVDHGGATAIRLVDCVNDEIGFDTFSSFVSGLFDAEGHEYIDLFCLNFDRTVLRNSGFVECSAFPDLIVPNFFEPFLQEAEVKHFVTTLDGPHLYKGDGDADRPFRLEYPVS